MSLAQYSYGLLILLLPFAAACCYYPKDFTAANTSLCNTTTQLQEVKSELAKFKPQIAFVDSMSADDMRGVLLQLQQAQGIYLQVFMVVQHH